MKDRIQKILQLKEWNGEDRGWGMRAMGIACVRMESRRVYNEALETRSNDSDKESGAKIASVWYAKDMCGLRG